MNTPSWPLPEITLPAPAAVPPIVLSAGTNPRSTRRLDALPRDRAGAGDVGADVVALDHVARRAAVDVHTAALVARR